jgi:polygalacturonase
MEQMEQRLFLSVTTTPHFGSLTYNITTYGASTGSSDNSADIQAAINAASAATGGGTVIVPTGTFLSGALTLKSNVNLEINGQLEMLAMKNWTSDTTDFITGKNLTNVEISGTGTINGQGAAWWAADGSSSSRPKEVVISDSSDIEITGITLTNSPMEHIQIQNTCNQVTINNVTIATDVGEASTSYNTDGMDISGQHEIIENCHITTGDDDIAIGANDDTSGGTSDITVTNCVFGGSSAVKSADLQGHGLSIGSNEVNNVSNVTVTSCTFNDTDFGIRIKSPSGQAGTVSNITYSNITMNGVRDYAIFFDDDYDSTPTLSNSVSAPTSGTLYENITMTGITMSNCAAAGYFLGAKDDIIQNVKIQLSGTAGKAFEIAYAGTSSTPISFTGSTFTVNGSTSNRVLVFADAYATGY